MIEITKGILSCQKGAMDRILVTLLLVIIAVSLVIGSYNYYNTHKLHLQNSSDTQINRVLTEISG